METEKPSQFRGGDMDTASQWKEDTVMFTAFVGAREMNQQIKHLPETDMRTGV